MKNFSSWWNGSDSQQKTNENISTGLHIAQYFGVLYSAYQFYHGNNFTALGSLLAVFNLESLAAKANQYFGGNNTRSQYISQHYSKLTQLPSVLKPAATTILTEVAKTVRDDVNDIRHTFKPKRS